MGLGGGGTSYITGYEALFTNPANLQIREKNYSLQLSLAESGIYYDSPFRIKNGQDRIDSFSESIETTDAVRYQFDENSRQDFLKRNYDNEQQNRNFQSNTEIYWFGVKWFRQERSYALSLRTRYGSRYNAGRGFYDPTPAEVDGELQIDRSLTHQYQTLHELSFGYSDNYTFLSGLFPRISKFIIGIAPKIVVSGAMSSVEYSNRYSRETADDPWIRESNYNLQSTGVVSESIRHFQTTGDPYYNSIGMSDLMKPTGIGGAIDVGITYLFTFGDDFSLIRRGEEPTEKSLRLSASITDLGLLHYFDEGLQAETNNDPEISNPGAISHIYYAGAPLQDLVFLSETEEHPLRSDLKTDSGSFQTILPTSLQTGILFQINRIKMMGDFQLGLTDNAFHTRKFTSYIGIEIRPLPFLPLRAGTRFTTDLPGYYSFGAGLETQYFDLSAAVQFRSTAAGPTLEPVAASGVAIKFYIP